METKSSCVDEQHFNGAVSNHEGLLRTGKKTLGKCIKSDINKSEAHNDKTTEVKQKDYANNISRLQPCLLQKEDIEKFLFFILIFFDVPKITNRKHSTKRVSCQQASKDMKNVCKDIAGFDWIVDEFQNFCKEVWAAEESNHLILMDRK